MFALGGQIAKNRPNPDRCWPRCGAAERSQGVLSRRMESMLAEAGPPPVEPHRIPAKSAKFGTLLANIDQRGPESWPRIGHTWADVDRFDAERIGRIRSWNDQSRPTLTHAIDHTLPEFGHMQPEFVQRFARSRPNLGHLGRRRRNSDYLGTLLGQGSVAHVLSAAPSRLSWCEAASAQYARRHVTVATVSAQTSPGPDLPPLRHCTTPCSQRPCAAEHAYAAARWRWSCLRIRPVVDGPPRIARRWGAERAATLGLGGNVSGWGAS